jgi:hypothetical protein
VLVLVHSVPNGTRLAAGGVQITENDLAVVRNINASGIITGTLDNTLHLPLLAMD